MKYSRRVLDSITVLTSFSTLFCCALPALFVALGAGAALVGIVSAVPQLVWFSEHKTPVFIMAGVLLGISGVLRYLARHAPCPLDPAQARACQRIRRIGLWIYLVSVLIYGIGFFFAFIAPFLME